MKKLVFFLLFIWMLIPSVFADYQVDNATVNAQVAESGKAQVTATYQLTFHAAQEELRVPLPDGEISRVSAGNLPLSGGQDRCWRGSGS